VTTATGVLKKACDEGTKKAVVKKAVKKEGGKERSEEGRWRWL
jgi:hypothetical protein